MRRLLFNIFLATLLIPASLLAHEGKLKGKHTKEKTIKKEYRVNSDALLKIRNSFGNLNLSSWNENKVVIEVRIKTNGDDEEKVIKKLEEIDVIFEASPSEVSARTSISENKSGWNWNWGKNNKVSMQIDYIVKLPVKNSINLNNDYGTITIDRIDGHARINCDYGSLEIGELRGRNNLLAFDYTKNSRIEFMNSGKISADYSEFTIEKAGSLEISADYTHSKVEEMEDLSYKSDYGHLDIGSVRNVQGNGDYISVYFKEVHGNVDISADYGSLKISNLTADAGNVLINTDYTSVKMGYDPGYAFDFEIRTEYAGVSGMDAMELSTSERRSTSKFFKGYHGKSGSGNRMNIKTEYGSVTLYKR